jgi:hypothetical protein
MDHPLRKYLQGATNGSQFGNSSQPSSDHKPVCSSADECCSVRRQPAFPGDQMALWLRSHSTMLTSADQWCESCSRCCGSIKRGSVCLQAYPRRCPSRSVSMELQQSCTGVPFDSRLQRCVTTTEDDEVLAIEYRWRSDLQPAAKPRMQLAVAGAVLIGCVMLLAFF